LEQAKAIVGGANGIRFLYDKFSTFVEALEAT